MNADERTCPECAETIKKAAAVCKHCGHRFRSASASDAPPSSPNEKTARDANKGCLYAVVVVVAFVALVAYCTPSTPENSAEASGTSAAAEGAEDENPLADRSVQMNWVIMSQDGVKARLRDPDSADFRNVGFYSGGAAAGVCGEVNAKNGFGGYTGFVRFIASGENTVFLASDTTAKEFGEAWNSICVKADTDDVQIP